MLIIEGILSLAGAILLVVFCLVFYYEMIVDIGGFAGIYVAVGYLGLTTYCLKLPIVAVVVGLFLGVVWFFYGLGYFTYKMIKACCAYKCCSPKNENLDSDSPKQQILSDVEKEEQLVNEEDYGYVDLPPPDYHPKK